MWKTGTAILATALVIGFTACDDEPTGPDERFVANLSASPGVTTSATGTARFDLEDGVVSFTIDVANITDVIGAHIHGPAGAGASAGVLVPLFSPPAEGTGTVNGQLAAGTFTAANISGTTVSMDSLLVLMRNGQSYVNVHTEVNKGGEIRGQIQRQ